LCLKLTDGRLERGYSGAFVGARHRYAKPRTLRAGSRTAEPAIAGHSLRATGRLSDAPVLCLKGVRVPCSLK